MPRRGSDALTESSVKQYPKMKHLAVNLPLKSGKRSTPVKGKGLNTISAEDQER
jgi:hypothetical protein